jgi:hypothetical protein
MARIYQAPTMGEAHIRAALVSARGMADLLVHRVGTWGQAHGDGLWYITRDKQEPGSTSAASAWPRCGSSSSTTTLRPAGAMARTGCAEGSADLRDASPFLSSLVCGSG